MSKIVVIGGGKGGVGKSVVTIGIIDSLLQTKHSVKLIAIESDDSNPDVYKTVNEHITCHVVNLDNEAGYIKLCELIDEFKDYWIVINTPARATDNLIRYCNLLSDKAHAQNRELTLLWPINRQRDSIELLRKLIDNNNGAFTSIHTVINTFFGAQEKFARYNASKTKELVTSTIVFPELNDLIADKLNDERLPPWNADSRLSIADRSALNRYRTAITSALKGVIS